MQVYIYLGDPLLTTTERYGPLTVASVGVGTISLQNTTDAVLSNGKYTLQPGEYLNQQPPNNQGPRTSYGVFGAAAKVGPWETFGFAGSILGAWTSDVYGAVVVA